MSHILLNYAFLLFWNIFGEIHGELFFLDIKWLSPKKAPIYSESLFFLPCLKRGKSRGKFVFVNCFWSNQWRGQILTKTVFLPKLCHTAKLCFFVVLKHFWGNSQRTSLFSQKRVFLWKDHWNTQNFFFLPCLKRGKSWEKFGFL